MLIFLFFDLIELIFSFKSKAKQENPLFLTAHDDLLPFFNPEKKKLFQTSFYKSQRKKMKILIDNDQNPVGGKWTYDDMNRHKFPKNKKWSGPSFSF